MLPGLWPVHVDASILLHSHTPLGPASPASDWKLGFAATVRSPHHRPPLYYSQLPVPDQVQTGSLGFSCVDDSLCSLFVQFWGSLMAWASGDECLRVSVCFGVFLANVSAEPLLLGRLGKRPGGWPRLSIALPVKVDSGQAHSDPAIHTCSINPY